jgi:hypothetical protein
MAADTAAAADAGADVAAQSQPKAPAPARKRQPRRNSFFHSIHPKAMLGLESSSS